MIVQAGILIQFYTINTFIISLIQILIINISIISFFNNTLFIAPFFLVLCYFKHTFIDRINENFYNIFKQKNNWFKRQQNIKQLIGEHNEFCEKLFIYNKFLSKIYFAIILNMIPMSLLILQQVLFEDLEYKAYLLMVFMLVTWIVEMSFYQYYYALLSLKIHKTRKHLPQLQWRINGCPFRVVLRNKLQLMAYFERLNSNNKIGLTIGPTIVLTLPVFTNV